MCVIGSLVLNSYAADPCQLVYVWIRVLVREKVLDQKYKHLLGRTLQEHGIAVAVPI